MWDIIDDARIIFAFLLNDSNIWINQFLSISMDEREHTTKRIGFE